MSALAQGILILQHILIINGYATIHTIIILDSLSGSVVLVWHHEF